MISIQSLKKSWCHPVPVDVFDPKKMSQGSVTTIFGQFETILGLFRLMLSPQIDPNIDPKTVQKGSKLFQIELILLGLYSVPWDIF